MTHAVWMIDFRISPYGSVFKNGPTVLAKLEPLEASQLIDQVIAPRMLQCAGGTNEPQLLPLARQLSALLITDGETYPPPAAEVEAGRPRATGLGLSPPCN